MNLKSEKSEHTCDPIVVLLAEYVVRTQCKMTIICGIQYLLHYNMSSVVYTRFVVWGLTVML